MFRKGYSTIELLAVLSTMAVMSSTILPSFSGFQEEAKVAKCQAEVKTLQGIVERYRTAYGCLPESLDLGAMGDKINVTDQLMADPFTSKPYVLQKGQTETGKDFYIIYSPGRNGTADFLRDRDTLYVRNDDVVASNLMIIH